MGWLIACIVIAVVIFVVLAVLAASVPSTERASNGDMLILLALSAGCAVVIVALAYAGASLFQGIF